MYVLEVSSSREPFQDLGAMAIEVGGKERGWIRRTMTRKRSYHIVADERSPKQLRIQSKVARHLRRERG